MFTQCKTPEELSIISEKIANLVEASLRKSKSMRESSSPSISESDHPLSNKDDYYGLDIDELIT